ncbi:MAG: OmpA family protein [Elusimicrobiaceae bacterium]|nr:OmpA family protein [Elusimicrobiaceae bacterium]
MKNLLKVTLVLALAAGLTACKKNVKDDANADMATLSNGAATEMVIEETTVVEVEQAQIALGTIYFALDKATLTADARKVVEANAKAIKAAAGTNYNVVVEGNCDDRGTIAYNIALGEKRANEVKDYYVRLGIPAANITTVSYGKEKPVCYEATQACWAKNRRAETILTAN